MSSWQILSDDENNFRWEISEVKPNDASNTTHFHIPNSSSPLPSMSDLLLQGFSIVKETRVEGVKDTPMFRTGLGKFVAVSQSSIAKALSVLGGDAYADAGEEHSIDNGCSFSNSLFKTGSGKIVNISSNGLVRAKTLLGFEEDTVDYTFQSVQQTKKMHVIGETYEIQHSPHLHLNKGINSYKMMNVVSSPSPSLTHDKTSVGGTRTLENDSEINLIQPEKYSSSGKQDSVKFYTAGGRSISVSNDALQRARTLLGDPDLGNFLNEGDVGDSVFSFLNERQSDGTASADGNDPHTPSHHHIMAKSKHMTKSFTSPLKSTQMEYSTKILSVSSGSNLMTKFDAVGKEIGCSLQSSITYQQKPLKDKNQVSDTAVYNSSLNDFPSRIAPLGRSPRGTFVDISNTVDTEHANNRQPASGKRRLGSRVTVSPFKKPRSFKFSAPLNQDVAVFPNGFSKLSSNNFGCKRNISTRFPFQSPRMHIREFFGKPILEQKMLEHFPNQARQVTLDNAEKYMFHDGSGLNGMGSEAFFHQVVQHGASTRYASKEWVTNHYKWIVWKLACYERCFPARSSRKFLTMSNVLEELKYRYEREVNHGHRSAIKKILEGDACSSSMMILCISAIHPDQGLETMTPSETKSEQPKSSEAVKVELTDGWYSMTAILDVPLSKQFAAGRLFVGQKLRIWGAGLCGWIGPVSPLEVSPSVSLQLHINGTYRAHWAEKLGLCKHTGPPLAFRCIKGDGGLIPQTLAGISRIYPILYKERLSNGGSVVRSERMETNMMQLYNQRRTAVVEGIISKFEKERKDSRNYDDGSEGAKIYKMLETSAEPEFLMADMSPDQLSSFVAYKAKLEATRQSNMEKLIENALKDAGLNNREVTQFTRVRIVGLTHKSRKDLPTEGLVTIWNPTEKQRQELVEGQAYLIAGLIPSGPDSDILHLQTRGSSTKWLPLSSSASEQFKSFFSCRKSISLSSLSEIPLSGEFDTAAYIVHVGEVYTSGHQKKQWVFVTDGSSLQSGQSITSLLAICFCSRSLDYDLIPPINYNLSGSTVGLCNLIKKEKDHINHIWVAEATEHSTYYLTFDSPQCSHLRNAAISIRRWANISSSTIDKIKEKVLSVVGDCKD
ncbi:protein BREAST CANCER SUSCEPTIBILITY 2-like protein B-like isoform X1 [Senna tora]|uniref:Protein BREAST CANCER SUSCEPTIBILITY 2-like protein B-like isoform X1 n=1 Tax=Senna tora TaxID=362788 RepID=A0A834TP26_9FABA|nr:protein BREAST CANCER SUSCEPTIBILITY 2-like protein B-like isoform X1 [Senna tora]